MKITQVEAIPVLIPFNTEWEIATGSDYGEGYVIVKIHTDSGLTGIGETGRFFEGEFQAGIVQLILNYFQPLLQQAPDPLNLNTLHVAMSHIKGNRFAKSAIDVALHDLKAKALGISVRNLLGGEYRSRILMCQSIGIKEKSKVIADAIAYVEQGYKSLKIKIGLDPEADLELVKTIREAIGPEPMIRVDANAAYSAAVAIPMLRKMEAYNLSLIEQPVPLWDLDGLRRVAEALDTPILACESARLPEDVMNLAKVGAVDMVNIKIGRTRGLVGAKKMEAVAEAAGLPVCVGTMMELGVGTIAAAQFAATVRTLTDTCDFTGPSLLTDDILTTPVCIQDGYLHLPEGPGLGIELDEDKLRYYQVR